MDKKRSKGVTVFAVLFLLLALLWTYATIFKPYTTFHKRWTYICLSSSLVLFAFLTSFGLFRLKEWGRKLALALGTYWILFITCRAIKDAILVVNKLYGEQAFLANLIGTLTTSLVFLGIPIFLLWWFFTRPKVKEQFKK